MDALENRRRVFLAQIHAARIARAAHLGRRGMKLRRGAQIRLPQQAEPNGIRRAYMRALDATVISTLQRLVDARLKPRLGALVAKSDRAHGRTDADEDSIPGILDGIAESFFAEFPNERLGELARQYAQATSIFQREQLAKQLRAALGVDVLGSEPHLTPMVDAFTEENVALIRSIPDDLLSDLAKRLPTLINGGMRAGDLEQVVQDRLGVSESRATLIARDQVGKFYGRLNQTRQQNLGVDSYRWRTMDDNRVRPEHALRDGRLFKWAEPPADGNPGEPINCRCYGDPDLAPILDALPS